MSKQQQSLVRIHVAEHSATAPPWRLTPSGYDAAAKQFPALAGRIVTTFGDQTAASDVSLGEAEILFAGDLPLRNLAERAPRLKWVQSTSAGIEDLIPQIPPGIALTNTSGIYPPKGGEFLMTTLLLLNQRIPHFVTNQRKARWEPIWSTTINGKTVLIIGTGAIGSAAARLARRFKMRVLGLSRSARPRRFFDQIYGLQDLKRLLPSADFVIVAAPLTVETRGLLGKEELDLLPRHAGIVNVGRGLILDCNALVDKLQKGELSGAVLDVFAEEPLPAESPLWSAPNLIISPHCGIDDAVAFLDKTFQLFFKNLTRYLAGKRLANLVDLKQGY